MRRINHSRWRGLASLLAALCLLPGCATYKVKDAAQAKLETMPHRLDAAELSLGVDPYVEDDREQRIFAANLLAAAVLPVQVMVKNHGERPVRIEPDHFKLILPNEHMAAPRSALEVAQVFAPKEGVGDYASAGAGVLGGLAGPIGMIAGRLLGFVSSGVFDRYRAEALQARQQDYARKEFKNALLAKDQSASGFLFFVLPKETSAFDQATLTLTVIKDPTETASLKMLLTGLGYPGPSASD